MQDIKGTLHENNLTEVIIYIRPAFKKKNYICIVFKYTHKKIYKHKKKIYISGTNKQENLHTTT